MVPVIFPHSVTPKLFRAADQKQQLFWPEPGPVLASTPAAAGPVLLRLFSPSLAEW